MVFKPAQANLVDIIIDNFARLFFRHTFFAQAETNILPNGEPWKQCIGLEHHAAIGTRPFDGLTFQCHRAGAWLVETGNDAQKRGLAAARRAENGDKIILGNDQVCWLQCQSRSAAMNTWECAAHTFDNKFLLGCRNHYANLQAKSQRLKYLKARSEIRPITPITMIPKMICPVAISACELIIM